MIPDHSIVEVEQSASVICFMKLSKVHCVHPRDQEREGLLGNVEVGAVIARDAYCNSPGLLCIHKVRSS